MRIDKYLKTKLPQISRHQIEKALLKGDILVNQKQVKPSYQVKPDDSIKINIIPNVKTQKLIPLPLIPEPRILYEDNELLAIDKPAGINVHPTIQNLKQSSIASWLVYKYPKIMTVGDDILRPGIVHRLDKDTSGVLLVAKNQESFLYLKNLFLTRQIEKTYLALVRGVIKKENGVIDFSLIKSRTFGKRKIVLRPTLFKKEKPAITYYQVEQRYQDFTLLKVIPKTGRTHQIRVHLASIGFPVAGDKVYGRSKKSRLIFSRQMLHAKKIVFFSSNHTKLTIFSPLPNDFKQVLQGLRPIA